MPRRISSQPQTHLTRRRALTLFASAGGSAFLSFPSAAAPQMSQWHGTALGGDVSLLLDGFDERLARRLINQAVDEIAHLEKIFSLYDKNSEISKLNSDGTLGSASSDLIEALMLSGFLHKQTDGAFDPTVQPLWTQQGGFQSDAYSSPVDNQKEVAALRSRIGFEHVRISGNRVDLDNGAQITLNGIAQGFITDKIAHLFQQAGARHTLINLGEFCANGPKTDGTAWRIGLRDPMSAWQMEAYVSLTRGALATSSNLNGANGTWRHLFDPRTGAAAETYASVSVQAPTAALADGLSTALFVTPREEALKIAARFPGTSARFTDLAMNVFSTETWQERAL